MQGVLSWYFFFSDILELYQFSRKCVYTYVLAMKVILKASIKLSIWFIYILPHHEDNVSVNYVKFNIILVMYELFGIIVTNRLSCYFKYVSGMGGIIYDDKSRSIYEPFAG